MVSLCNGGSAGESSNAVPSRNGYMPTRLRKVFAIRDFPPMCGPNARKVDSKSEENRHAAGGSAESSGANLCGMTNGEVAAHVQNSESVHVLGINGVKKADLGKMDQVSGSVKEFVNGSANVSETDGATAVEGSNGAEGFRLLANVSMEDTGPAVKDGSSGDKMEMPGGSQASLIASRSTKLEASPRPKDKYRQRRVSADRDFPPLCGSNFPQSTKEPQLMASGETLSSVGRGSSVEMLNSDAEPGASQETRAAAEGLPLRRKMNGCVEDLKKGKQDGDVDKIDPKRPLPGSRSSSKAVRDEVNGGAVRKRTAFSSTKKTKMRYLCDVSSSGQEKLHREAAQGMMAAPSSQWRKRKAEMNGSGEGTSQAKVSKQKHKTVTRKKGQKANSSGEPCTKKKLNFASSGVGRRPGALILKDQEDHGGCSNDGEEDLPKLCDFDVRLPPFGPNSSSSGDARNRVREILRLFHAVCRKLLKGEESKMEAEPDGKPKHLGKRKFRRIDYLAVKMMKEGGKQVKVDNPILGEVPGVEVGDEFQYRVELAIVGIHRLYQNGIDTMKYNGQLVANSIVSSGSYWDDTEDADVLWYCGQGGNVVGKFKIPEDQKLERGNLALRNCISAQTPVRVIRGWKENATDLLGSRDKIVMNYVYDGLYKVTNYKWEEGPHGKMVFMFELKRIPGQPEVAWKELKKSNKSKIRPGTCVNDISGGREPFPICAVNALDNEKPPPFTYMSKIEYPDWYKPIRREGCNCIGRCSDSRKCRCAAKNGGQIPYNHNGAIVEAKPLVYECGPACKCPPSCYNRVSQHGSKFQLEIFKTKSRGWGVRSLNSIAAGSFICEYVGEILDEYEAENRITDEYLFDIGQNYSDLSLKPDEQANSDASADQVGFTIDAAQCGNVGRFINHSCSPNLYAQNVLYDHEDKKLPHIMFFAAENIPPLQELTYHYNYTVDQVFDSNGNIKIKKCYCGSAECTGRMY